MSPDELKLLAYHQEIEIHPLTNLPTLHLLETDYGPLTPHSPAKVPIHTALFLHKSNLCKIPLPFFLTLDYLEDVKQQEKNNENEYASIYPYIFEVYDDILRCVDCNVEEIRMVLSEIRDVRMEKSRRGLVGIDGRALNLNNLTVYEYEQIKSVLLDGMEMALRMEK
ncbi:hypothetical protein VCUG_00452 [Vavraia culicis subsp. floridensis]|uniref:Uncharacterized protein n=1 Tax=Vavraia culicis (isolate floridensis) TaxID=948595 RepID=L2GWM3_VAVCU|nr:uncharacterized protein VCUG_00452 [Vavraia culicis subsp. floridensis]ELA48029.1 hypothetical protein VCUG_00452 [Vavraia culicis subsp. floridensis]